MKRILLIMPLLWVCACGKDPKPIPPVAPTKVGWIKGIRWKRPPNVGDIGWQIDYVYDNSGSRDLEHIVAMGHEWEFEVYDGGQPAREKGINVDCLLVNPSTDTYACVIGAQINMVGCNNSAWMPYTPYDNGPGYISLDAQKLDYKKPFLYLTKTTDNNGAFKMRIYLDRRVKDKPLLAPFNRLNYLMGFSVWMRVRINDIGDDYFNQFVYGAATWSFGQLAGCGNFDTCQGYGFGSLNMTDTIKNTWRRWEDTYNQPQRQSVVVESDNPPWYSYVCGSPCYEPDTATHGIPDCLPVCAYGVPDSDQDGVADCSDPCPNNSYSTSLPCRAYGDANGDGSVDMNDFGALQRCLGVSSPFQYSGEELSAECRPYDQNHDHVINDQDFAVFLQCASRSGIHTSCQISP